MKNSVKISVLGACMFLSASVYSQSDSLGMPGDNLDLNAVLSIFKQSSSVEDFEKRLNSADTKVNNIDLNNDNQVDYLRVVDYGKDDFHSLVIQDPISKTETQDVAVIEVVKKGDNTAHIQIVGDETLYGKNYIIEPENQAPLATSSSNNSNANNNTASDDVYASQNSSSGSGTSQVMINVWGWPSVGYLYSPGYAYYSSPWYYGYYPGWFMPWRPYGWYAYHSGWMGYNYGFYGYRRNYYAFPHVHNYYYGHRMQSGYVQKNAANYGRRTTGANYNGGRARTTGQPRNTGTRNQVAGRNSPNRPNSATAVRNKAENNRVQNNNQQRQGSAGNQRNTNQRAQNNGGQRVSAQNNGGNNSGARSNGGAARMDNGGGGRMNSGGGGRMSGGGGGGRMSGGGGGGGHMGGGGGGHMGGGGGHGGGGGGHR